MYTYAAKVWDLSIVSSHFLSPRAKPPQLRFTTCIAVWCLPGGLTPTLTLRGITQVRLDAVLGASSSQGEAQRALLADMEEVTQQLRHMQHMQHTERARVDHERFRSPLCNTPLKEPSLCELR
jgi:hypothetical protein